MAFHILQHNTKAFRENSLLCAVQITQMKSRLSVLSIMFLFSWGCTKDNSPGGGPVIGIKSYTSAVYNDGNDFNAVITFSQKGGSPSGDSLTIIRHRYNQSYVPNPVDTFGTRLPITPSVDKAEFTATLQWQFIEYGINGENDTCDFRFVLVDLNQNHSDTVSTGTVIIYQF
jgi:hypothetical protein